MNPVLTQIKLTPIGDILEYPASSVFLPREIFVEYHLLALNCTIIGEWLEITRFVVQDKGCNTPGPILCTPRIRSCQGRGVVP